MPVELTERQLQDAIALMAERHEHGGQAADALAWVAWDGEGPLLLRRYDVQRFMWYTLPRKFLMDLDGKRDAAELLALTLEQLGGRCRGYAEVCRSEATQNLLCLWEAEDPAARQRFRELMDASGIEPPNTNLLTWGSVMGWNEARIREQVATCLEQAIEDGHLRGPLPTCCAPPKRSGLLEPAPGDSRLRSGPRRGSSLREDQSRTSVHDR